MQGEGVSLRNYRQGKPLPPGFLLQGRRKSMYGLNSTPMEMYLFVVVVLFIVGLAVSSLVKLFTGK